MPRTPLPFTRNLKPWQTPPKVLTKEKILSISSGYFGRARNCQRIARNRVEKGLQHAYRGRKLNRRNQRTWWIMKMNAGARNFGMTYGNLIQGLNQSNIALNRKILADLAHHEPYSFQSVVEHVRDSNNIVPKMFPNLGYIQSVIVTQQQDVFQYPIRPRGRQNPSQHRESHAMWGKKAMPKILSREEFNFPYEETYVQRSKNHPSYWSRKDRKYAAKHPAKTRQEEVEFMKEMYPEYKPPMQE